MSATITKQGRQQGKVGAAAALLFTIMTGTGCAQHAPGIEKPHTYQCSEHKYASFDISYNDNKNQITGTATITLPGSAWRVTDHKYDPITDKAGRIIIGFTQKGVGHAALYEQVIDIDLPMTAPDTKPAYIEIIYENAWNWAPKDIACR